MHPILATAQATPVDSAASQSIDWAEHLLFIAVGFGWVMATLIVLYTFTVLAARIIRQNTEPKPARKTTARLSPKPEAANTSKTTGGIPDHHFKAIVAVAAAATKGNVPHHHLACIAAAIKATEGEHTRVLAIRTLPTGWALEGRRQIFQSHKIR